MNRTLHITILSRRFFLKRLFFGLLAAGGSLLASACHSKENDEHSAVPIPLGVPADFPPGGSDLGVFRVRIVREDTDTVRRYAAVSLVCTHQTCLVRSVISSTAEEFVCPCHGSRFSATGAVTHGPAAKPLSWYRLSVSPAGQLLIHKSETVAPDWRLELAV